MKKKWIWKEFAETLGVLGVIGSLAFVALEIRQNTAAVRSQAAQGVMDQISSVLGMVITDPELTEVLTRGMADPTSLSPTELAQFQSFFTVSLQSYQNLFIQVREGALDRDQAEGWWQLLRNTLNTPGVEYHWETRSYLLSPEFRSFVNTEVVTREPTTGYTPFDSGAP